MYKSAEHKAFLREKYDQDKFIEKTWLKEGKEGKDLYTYAEKCAVEQLGKQAAEYVNDEVIEDLTQHLFAELWSTLRNKSGLETMLDAYKYSTTVIQERVKDLPLKQWFVPVQLKDYVEQAAYNGKKTEKFRDKEGKPRERPAKGESGEYIDATEYKLDPYHQAYLAGNTRRKAQARNDTDLIEFEELGEELSLNEPEKSNNSKRKNTDQLMLNEHNFERLNLSTMIGHNGPPAEEALSAIPDDRVWDDEEDDKKFIKEASQTMSNLGMWDFLRGKERDLVRKMLEHLYSPDAHNKGNLWPWYEAGRDMGMSKDAVRKNKQRIAKKLAPEQIKRNNIKHAL